MHARVPYGAPAARARTALHTQGLAQLGCCCIGPAQQHIKPAGGAPNTPSGLGEDKHAPHCGQTQTCHQRLLRPWQRTTELPHSGCGVGSAARTGSRRGAGRRRCARRRCASARPGPGRPGAAAVRAAPPAPPAESSPASRPRAHTCARAQQRQAWLPGCPEQECLHSILTQPGGEHRYLTCEQ